MSDLNMCLCRVMKMARRWLVEEGWKRAIQRKMQSFFFFFFFLNYKCVCLVERAVMDFALTSCSEVFFQRSSLLFRVVLANVS